MEEALQLATKAQAIAPGVPQIADTLAWLYVKKNQLDTAIQILHNLTKGGEGKATHHFHLGAALLRKGNGAEAKKHLQIALSRQPSQKVYAEIQQLLSAAP